MAIAATTPKNTEIAMAMVIAPNPAFVPVAFYVPLSFRWVKRVVLFLFYVLNLRVDFFLTLG